MTTSKESHWVRYIKKRINLNRNFIAITTGATGSGKSFACLHIAELLDADFSIRQVVFKGVELLRLVNSGALKKGSVIVWEEVGVTFASRNWQGTINKLLNYLLQTFRHKNFILLMNAPVFDFLDSGTRKLLHAEFKTAGINLRTEKVALRPIILQYNSRFSKFYYHKLKVRNADRRYTKVGRWFVGKPSEALLKDYMEKKEAFTSKLNAEILEELEALEGKGARRQELTEVQAEVLGYLKAGLTLPEIAGKRKRAVEVIRQNVHLIKQKGYVITPIWEGGRITRYDVFESGQKDVSDVSERGAGAIN